MKNSKIQSLKDGKSSFLSIFKVYSNILQVMFDSFEKFMGFLEKVELINLIFDD